MKNISHILITTLQCLIALSLLFLGGCVNVDISSKDGEVPVNIIISTTRVNEQTKLATLLYDQETKINSIRIYVFNSSDSFITMAYKDVAGITPSVSMFLRNIPNFQFYVIVNEPVDLAIKTKLDAITSISELNNIQYEFAHYFNNDLGVFSSDASGLEFCLPMVANATVPSVTSSPINIQVTRSLARIDVMLQKEEAIESANVQMNENTSFSIGNIGSKGYLFSAIVQSENELTYPGRLVSGPVTPLIIPVSNPLITDNSDYARIFCFYTPERTHQSNKMRFGVTEFRYNEINYSSDNHLLLANVSKIERNKIYKVYCRVGERKNISIEHIAINDWANNSIDVGMNDGGISIFSVETEIIDGENKSISTVMCKGDSEILVRNDAKEYVSGAITFDSGYFPVGGWLAAASWTPVSGNKSGTFSFTKNLGFDRENEEIFYYEILVKCGYAVQKIIVGPGDTEAGVDDVVDITIINNWDITDTSVDMNDGKAITLTVPGQVLMSSDASPSGDINYSASANVGISVSNDGITWAQVVTAPTVRGNVSLVGNTVSLPSWLSSATWTKTIAADAATSISEEGHFNFTYNKLTSTPAQTPYYIRLECGNTKKIMQVVYTE